MIEMRGCGGVKAKPEESQMWNGKTQSISLEKIVGVPHVGRAASHVPHSGTPERPRDCR